MAQKSVSVQRTLTRAASHAKKGESQQAYQLYKAVLDKFPKNAQAANGIAGLQSMQKVQQNVRPPQEKIDEIMRLYEAKQYKQALEKTQALVKVYPRFQGLYNIAGVILAEVGQWENAIKAYHQALSLKPDYGEAYYNYAIALQNLERTDEAISILRKAIKAEPNHAEAHYNLGNLLTEQGKESEAILSFQRAVTINPDFIKAHANLGNCYKNLGRIDDAMACYNKTIEIQPDFAEGYIELNSSLDLDKNDPRFEKMESLLNELKADDKAKVRLHFALAKTYERLGDIDKTFTLLSEGNRLRKAQKEYSTQMDKDLMVNIRTYFSEEISGSHDGYRPSKTGKTPIFIVGMPRSGTTLTEQILASHSNVFGAGELSALGEIISPEFASVDLPTPHALDIELLDKVREGYIERLGELNVSERIIVDKMPLNFRWVGFIFAAFPDAKIINLNRNPAAIGWSIFKYNFSSSGNRYAHDLQDIGEFYNLYIDLMMFWRKRFPGKIYDLSYEALTEDQEGETRKLLEYCDLEWEEACLDFHKTKRVVKTVSSSQVRKKMYKGSSQAWRKYEKHLGPLLDALDYKDA